MKKFVLATAMFAVLVSCEREVENVTESSDKNKKTLVNKNFYKQNEKTSSKTASDSLFIQNISPGAGTGLEEPIGDVDPGDIKTPPRR